MNKTRSIAGLLYTLPALAILMVIVFIPIMVVVNYSVQDVFSGNFFIWDGPVWFEKTLRSVEFWETLGRSVLYSSLVIAIEIPLGVFIFHKSGLKPPTSVGKYFNRAPQALYNTEPFDFSRRRFSALKMPKSGPTATLYIIIMAIPLLIPWFVAGLI